MKNIGILLLIVTSHFYCTPSNKQPNTAIENTDLGAKITTLSKSLLDQEGKIIPKTADQFIDLTNQYATNQKDTGLVVKYAYQGADVAKNTHQFAKAISFYDLLVKRYPNQLDIAAEALFAKAYVLENNSKNIKKAKEVYESILDKYPKAKICKDIPAELEAMGKSQDELLDLIHKFKK